MKQLSRFISFFRQIDAFDDSQGKLPGYISANTTYNRLLVTLPRVQTCIWPGPPGLRQSDPERSV